MLTRQTAPSVVRVTTDAADADSLSPIQPSLMLSPAQQSLSLIRPLMLQSAIADAESAVTIPDASITAAAAGAYSLQPNAHSTAAAAATAHPRCRPPRKHASSPPRLPPSVRIHAADPLRRHRPSAMAGHSPKIQRIWGYS